jgi:hypothetical protein
MRSKAAVNTSGRPTPELPALGPGLHLLEMDADSTGVLHSLVLDHLLLNPGQAYWVDSHNRIAPHHLARIAPSARVLDRIQIARGFTPYQHYTLIDRLARCVDVDLARKGTPPTDAEAERDGGAGEASASPVSLVVTPALDGLYREASDLRRGDREGREMFLHSVAVLDRLARRHDLAVLVSLSHADDLTAPVTRAATGTIRCEQTRFGPRFTVDGDDTATDRFETLVYPVGHGMVQTTLAFWREVLAARTPLYEQARPTAGATGPGAGSTQSTGAKIGSGVIADGMGTH